MLNPDGVIAGNYRTGFGGNFFFYYKIMSI